MHVAPDPGLAAIAGMATGPEPEPDDEFDMMDFLIDIEPLAMDYDDIATATELDGSGEALEVPEGWVRVAACPDKLTISMLEKHWIMFDWDSGWELGQIRRAKGRDVKLCAVKFDLDDKNDNETHMVELSADTYYTSTHTTGKWVLVKADE